MGFPKVLNAFDYARLKNEALRNDGIDSVNSGLYYPSTALQAYQNHSDPYNYPDVNWISEVTNQNSKMDRYTLSASGGNSFAKYFVSLEHINQSGFFKTVDSNAYNTNNNFKSYVIRSNVDVNINKKLSGGIYLLGRILNGNEPGSTSSSIISGLLNTPSNAYPLLNADGSFGGNQLYQNNLLAQAIASGYRTNYKRDMMVNIYLKRTLDEITKGLWINAKVAYYATLSENVARNKSFAVFQKMERLMCNWEPTVLRQIAVVLPIRAERIMKNSALDMIGLLKRNIRLIQLCSSTEIIHQTVMIYLIPFQVSPEESDIPTMGNTRLSQPLVGMGPIDIPLMEEPSVGSFLQ